MSQRWSRHIYSSWLSPIQRQQLKSSPTTACPIQATPVWPSPAQPRSAHLPTRLAESQPSPAASKSSLASKLGPATSTGPSPAQPSQAHPSEAVYFSPVLSTTDSPEPRSVFRPSAGLRHGCPTRCIVALVVAVVSSNRTLKTNAGPM